MEKIDLWKVLGPNSHIYKKNVVDKDRKGYESEGKAKRKECSSSVNLNTRNLDKNMMTQSG